jgi:hypothetical protein
MRAININITLLVTKDGHGSNCIVFLDFAGGLRLLVQFLSYVGRSSYWRPPKAQ